MIEAKIYRDGSIMHLDPHSVCYLVVRLPDQTMLACTPGLASRRPHVCKGGEFTPLLDQMPGEEPEEDMEEVEAAAGIDLFGGA